MQAFKLFGLQRTGTNLVRRLMLRNFEVASLERGSEWKHGWVTQPRRMWGGQPAIHFVCTKNPLAWLSSCYHYFRRAEGCDPTVPECFREDISLGQFLREPVYGFPDSVYRWNVMNRHWLTYLPEAFVVRQEDMLSESQQVTVLEDIQRRFGLKAKRPLAGTSRRVDVGMHLDGPMNAADYLAQRYLADFASEDLHWLREVCTWDEELLDRLAYRQWLRG